MMQYQSGRNVVFSSKYHVVFCPKYRYKVLKNGVDVRLKEIVRQLAEECKVGVIEMEVMPDHVHLLLEVNPQYGVNGFVEQLKGLSTGGVNDDNR